MRRQRRRDFLDSRVTQRAIDLFALGCAMLNDGVDSDSRDFWDVVFSLNKELGFKPWECNYVLELEAYDVPPEKLETEPWRIPRQLHRQLVQACA